MFKEHYEFKLKRLSQSLIIKMMFYSWPQSSTSIEWWIHISFSLAQTQDNLKFTFGEIRPLWTWLFPFTCITIYQSRIGAAQWVVYLASLDVATAIMTLSSLYSAPQQGHLDCFKQVCEYHVKMQHANSDSMCISLIVLLFPFPFQIIIVPGLSM